MSHTTGSHRAILWSFILACLSVAPGEAAEPVKNEPQPNVVFILADDLGWSDLGCYGADLHESPNLDRLAKQGVRFSRAYSMSVCSPTRACILTGKHAARLHMTIWREASVHRDQQATRSKRPLLDPVTTSDLPLSETTTARLLKEKGYLTFHVGKWHLGGPDNYPENHGFDVNIGGTHWGAPESFFWPFKGAKSFREPRYVPGLGIGKPGDYLTDRLTDEAIRLIEEAKDRPFFLNLWYHSVHTPIEGKSELVEQFRKKLRPGMRHQNPEYAAMVHTLDANVGRVLDRLQALGLADHTLVVFASDNGGYVNQFKGKQVTNNAPLRSGKGSLYEGGVRVPLIIRMPGVTSAGKTCDEPVMCTDFLPTIAELTGVKAETAVDGVSLVPLLRNPAAKLTREALFFHYPHYYPTTTPVSAVLAGEWKLLEYYEGKRVELYNLNDDPGEETDLAVAKPDRVKALQNRLNGWRRTVGAQNPLPNPSAGRSKGK